MVISSDIASRASGILKTFFDERPQCMPSSELGGANRTAAEIARGVRVSDLVEWLDDRVLSKGLSGSTALCYRRWVASYLESIGCEETERLRSWIPPAQRDEKVIVAAESADYVLRNEIDDEAFFVASSKNNHRYLSFVSEPVLNMLIAELMPPEPAYSKGNPSRNQIAGMETAMWFMCTVWTGLRPHEWPYARYLENHFDPDTNRTQAKVLEVKSLKQSGRREDNPLKEKRYLVLDGWPPQQLSALQIFLGIVQKHEDEGAFDEFYERRRKLLGRTWRRVLKSAQVPITHVHAEISKANRAKLVGAARSTSGPAVLEGNSISFVTARHVFAEEARRSGAFTHYEIAALLGHSMITNQSYYGPRQATLDREHSFMLPAPWPGDADAIELWDRTANPLRDQFMNRESLAQALLDTEARARANGQPDGVASFWIGS